MSTDHTTDLSSAVRQPGAASTLVELLRWQAEIQPNKVAYTYLVDGERQEVRLTYAELDRQARLIAAHLQRLGASGERVLLLYPSGLEFITAFFGCLYAGVVAVPTYPPRRRRRDERLVGIALDSQATIALTTSNILVDLKRRQAKMPELAPLEWLATDRLDNELVSVWQEPAIGSDTLAFLQYTSGSTGTPKGVMVSHGNLLHNLAQMHYVFEYTPDSHAVCWLPLYHDLGLIGNILQVIYSGGSMTLMSPVAFLQKPLRWLEAISRYQATHSGGPNFAYDLCARRITPEERARLDLSSWKMAFNGAEPVRAETLERFATAFADCGFHRTTFYPCYGLAEATLIVSARKKNNSLIVQLVDAAALEHNQVIPRDDMAPDTAPKDGTRAERQMGRALVGNGRFFSAEESTFGQKLLIVDPNTFISCSERQVGEIWVQSPSVAQGYWKQPESTRETFHAYLATPPLPLSRGESTADGPFLRTGDLGFVSDGELFITGRLKDLIIIRGRNYYPQDIELTVTQSHVALQLGSGAAFSVEVGSEERLVVVQEVKRTALRKLVVEEVVKAIRQAVSEAHELQVYALLLIKPVRIPKTSSGKIRRHACRAAFLAGSFEVVAEWFDVAVMEKREQMVGIAYIQYKNRIKAIQAWLVTKLSHRLAIPPQEIDVGQPFTATGLDSMAAINLSTALSDWLGHPLSPTLAYDYPTIAALAQHLAAEGHFDLDSAKSSPVPTSHDGHHIKETRAEPIAIIGMGCRFPGAESPEAFWELLRDGVDAIREVPAERWDVERFYSPEAATTGKMNTRWGGFIQQVEGFDAHFFGISPREAVSMDPQQRLLLEVSWEALEHANLSPDKLAGSQSGVFIGTSSNDYSYLLSSAEVDAYFGTGNATSIAANRLSYLLDLRGPSWAVDTACSSSLVALHQACQSLRQGESNLALAGGVNLILMPEVTMTFSQARMMASDGRCKTFDAAADGYVRSEGCGIVVLKRLSDAKRDGDQILALIRGSAVNQDGLSNGLTAPNGLAQQSVIRQALQHAGLSPTEISYVEAHGTGTALGDPIEVEALGQVFSQSPLMIGSVKTNIGHLEAAAGIAGMIKVVLSLQHQEIPPHLHFKTPNSYISWQNLPITVPTNLIPWAQKKRIAGVSSFGFGGTNAHVILSEAPVDVIPTLTDTESQGQHPSHLFTFSAKTQTALLALASRYSAYLEQHPDISLADLCFTTNTRRSHFNHRYALVAQSSQELREQLTALVAGREMAGVVTGKTQNASPSKSAFLFTGQGSQYVDMGRQLYETEPTFRAAMVRCDELLRATGYLEHSLLSVLYTPLGENLLNQTAYTQPALFALEYALVELWKSWGIEPFAVIGHSVGELVAACVAGVFSLEDGLKLIAARGALMQALPAGGEMVVVRADKTLVAAAIESVPKVAIAAVNGPNNTVISGEGEAVRRVVASLEAAGIKSKALEVSHAFHSPLMEPLLPDFELIAREITFHKPQLTLISNLTGKVVSDEVTTPAYWARHIRQSVRFADGMESLYKIGAEILIEIGPKPTLLGMASRITPPSTSGHGSPTLAPSLRQGRDDWEQMLTSLAHFYVRGVAVDFSGLYGTALYSVPFGYRHLQLPTYPWQRKRYWIEHAPKGRNKGVVTDYYNSLSLIGDEHESASSERFLTFAPFPEPVAGFSWIKVLTNPATYPEHAQMIVNAQKEIREILFGQIDFASVSKVLDFGCGYGSDLIALAQQYEHLKLSGYTISDKQAAIARQKIEAGKLAGRISIFTRDSARDDFPEHYDLVFGFEVASHIKDKPALFDNISRHLNPSGRVVLADFISNTSFAIEHEETSSYIVTREEWAPWLSQNQLEVVAGVDISPEVANFLYDPDFKGNLAAVADSNLDANVKAAVESYNHLAQLLRRNLASYVLLIVQKAEERSSAELYALNQEKLNALASYADVSLRRWLYDSSWVKQANALPVTQTVEPASWLIFADSGGMYERLAELFAQRGETALIVSAGEKREMLKAGYCTIDPTNPAHFEWLLQEGAALDAPLRGVIHLWALEDTPPVELTANYLSKTMARTCGSLLYLVQALNKLKPSDARLWVVTRGAVPVANENESLAVASSSLWGLGKVIAIEHPALWGGMLDLAPQAGEGSDDEAQAAALLAEISAPSGENQLAWRDGERYVARLVRSTYQSGQALEVSPSASYLITGGFGALGLHVARFLAAQGAQQLVLLGRSGISSSQAEQTISQLQAAGVKVQVIQADVSDVRDMEHLFDMLALTEPPLRGIVHAAGLLAFQAIESMELAAFKAVLPAKVEGTWLLHQLSQKMNMRLDFFVCFSSIASVWGSQGMAHYAAANHFMDAMAHYRRGLGLSALSVNWGAWAGGGMANAEGQRELAKVGIKSIPPQQAIQALEHLLGTGAVQATVANIDWTRFKALYEVRTQSQFFNQIVTITSQRHKAPTQQKEAGAAPAPEGLSTTISKEVAKVLRLAPEEISPEQALNTLGLDSLMMIELKNNLEVKWRISLPMADFAQDVTVAQLTALVQQQLANKPEPKPFDEHVTSTHHKTDMPQAMPIVPSQHWFFEENYEHPHQWNLYILFEVPPSLNLSLLQQALHYNLSHHEALRLRFHKNSTGWQQVINPPDPMLPFLQVDLSMLPDDYKSAAVEAKAAELQGTLNFTSGPILRLVHFDFGKQQVGRLFILVHHLVVDAFAFRLFVGDLFTVYQQLARKQEMYLPPLKISYANWVRELVSHANEPTCTQEQRLWLELLQGPITPLPLDFPDGDNNEASFQTYSLWMTIEESKSLFNMPAAFDVQITDILLMVLLEAYSAWTGSDTLYVETQGHGRDELLPGLDLSRSVCWANTIYPLLLRRAEQYDSPLENLRHVKKQLRHIPNSGLSYGLLRYLNQDSEIRQQLTALPKPEIKFQYHSYLVDSSSNQWESVQLAKESTGNNWGEANHAKSRLYVFGYVIAKQLKIELVYSKNLFKQSTIESLGQEITKQLRRLIEEMIE